MKGVNIFLAEGFEETEAMAPCDILRRGGVDVRLVSVDNESFVRGSHGMTVGADCGIDDISDSRTCSKDLMIFPGGMPGSANLAGCVKLVEAMNRHYAEGGALGAICAAPGLVLGRLEGAGPFAFTCYEGFQQHLLAKGCTYTPEAAVADGRIITGRGPGAAMRFGIELLRFLKGDTVADSVMEGMYIK